jgi:glycolate oxidase FAD binding subunit
LNLQSPATAEELAACLREAASRGSVIQLGGTFTKDRMGGAVQSPTMRVSTAAMRGVIQYEPNDLTVSVEAGLPWRELTAMLEDKRQMIPLDPPGDEGTVGGVIGANVSGPRRRWYGTARDVVIGMTFATLEGKLIQTGGMECRRARHGQAHDRLVRDAGGDGVRKFQIESDAGDDADVRVLV